MNRNVFTFVEGVEMQKNVICGATMFQLPNTPKAVALIKVTMTADGQNCEIVARSSFIDFGRYVIGNVLEMLALPRQK